MALPIHSKIINKVARRILKPNGIERKGQSRTWLDDQYWYTTIIEFQPFKDRQGTCLNIGVNFHWYEKEYFSFDIGNRESDFFDFKNEVQFEREMNSLTELALKRTIELRNMLSDLNISERTIINHEFSSDNLWGNYHRAIICGLNNELHKSDKYFNLVLSNDLKWDWELKLKNKVEILKGKMNNIAEFKSSINEIIIRSRTEKKLKLSDIKNVW